MMLLYLFDHIKGQEKTRETSDNQSILLRSYFENIKCFNSCKIRCDVLSYSGSLQIG